MSVWVVRAGKAGEFEDFCLQKSIVAIDFSFEKSVRDFADKSELTECLQREPSYRAKNVYQVGRAAGQLWRFAHEIQRDDLILLPLKSSRLVAVGRVDGDYNFRTDLSSSAPGAGHHTRDVNWLAIDIPRTDFDQDLLFSLGGLMTVFTLRADNAEDRIRKIMDAHLTGRPLPELSDPIYIPDDDTPDIDLDEQIEDRIVRRIRQKFSGDGLERLVASILRASGYDAKVTRQGPDGGVDIVAGAGDMGFGEPRLCAQVKSGSAPVGLPDYDRLKGNIQSFGAQHGLLVSLSDFSNAVRKANESSFFEIRLWGPHELGSVYIQNYTRTVDVSIHLSECSLLLH